MRLTLAASFVALAVLTTAMPRLAEKTREMFIPIAKHSSLVNEDNTANFEALYSQVVNTKAKLLRGFENFERNTGAAHPSSLSGKQKRGTGTDSLADYSSLLWYGAISVGTPESTFTVDFDTGSSDLFLPGPNCGSSCNGHKIYNPSDSSTSQDKNENFTLGFGPYGSSTVDVELYTDTVSIVGLTANGQALGVATQYTQDYEIQNFPPDGLLGMAFQELSTYKESPTFQSLVSQGQTDESVFAFKLTQSGAELDLGGVNPSAYTGDFTYTPVTEVAYWEVNMNGIVGNGKTILENIDSIIDTGTTLIFGDPTNTATLFAALNGTSIGQGYYSFPCDSFPSISFTFGTTSFPLSEESLNFGQVSPGSPDCVCGIIGEDIGASFWVVGDVFLQNVYTKFDVGNTQVGFATLA